MTVSTATILKRKESRSGFDPRSFCLPAQRLTARLNRLTLRRGRLHLTLHCHHQNDTCIKVGGDEGHFNVSLTVRDKVTRQRPRTTTFEEKGEPKRNRTEVPLFTSLKALPLGQTGSFPHLLRFRHPPVPLQRQCFVSVSLYVHSNHQTLMDREPSK